MDDALRAASRRRHRLYAIGTAVAIAGMTLGTMPYFAERTPILVANEVYVSVAAVRGMRRLLR